MKYDVVVIGAGHNGLISSIYLARAGLKVLVIEKNYKPGGMADTGEYKGVKYSRLSYVLGLMPKRIEEELGLKIPVIDSPLNDVYVTEDNRVLRVWRDRRKRIEEFRRLGQDKYEELENIILQFKKIMEDEFLFVTHPPSLEAVKGRIEGTKLEILLEKTRKVLSEYLDEEFHDLLDYGFMKELPAYIMAYYFSLDWRLVRGGMGKIGEVLYEKAKSFGVDFILGKEVEEIIFKERVKGVKIKEDGRVVEANIVLNATSPVLLSKLTRGELKVYHPEFRPRWRRSNLILRELPKLPDYIEKNPGTLYDLPIGELTIPSLVDELGGHVITVMGALEDTLEFFPDIKDKIIYAEEITSDVIEREYNAMFGDMNHMPMLPQFLFDNRPVKGWGYKTPIEGLYITGSGTYPGGQVTGIPGRNAAIKILKDLKRPFTSS
ncbi:MAG: NAD(P)/FAD-dependent oxidoreductase [Sulfolobaceae archaeon]